MFFCQSNLVMLKIVSYFVHTQMMQVDSCFFILLELFFFSKRKSFLIDLWRDSHSIFLSCCVENTGPEESQRCLGLRNACPGKGGCLKRLSTYKANAQQKFSFEWVHLFLALMGCYLMFLHRQTVCQSLLKSIICCTESQQTSLKLLQQVLTYLASLTRSYLDKYHTDNSSLFCRSIYQMCSAAAVIFPLKYSVCFSFCLSTFILCLYMTVHGPLWVTTPD